jgi:hypothetical protein
MLENLTKVTNVNVRHLVIMRKGFAFNGWQWGLMPGMVMEIYYSHEARLGTVGVAISNSTAWDDLVLCTDRKNYWHIFWHNYVF